MTIFYQVTRDRCAFKLQLFTSQQEKSAWRVVRVVVNDIKTMCY